MILILIFLKTLILFSILIIILLSLDIVIDYSIIIFLLIILIFYIGLMRYIYVNKYSKLLALRKRIVKKNSFLSRIILQMERDLILFQYNKTILYYAICKIIQVIGFILVFVDISFLIFVFINIHIHTKIFFVLYIILLYSGWFNYFDLWKYWNISKLSNIFYLMIFTLLFFLYISFLIYIIYQTKFFVDTPELELVRNLIVKLALFILLWIFWQKP